VAYNPYSMLPGDISDETSINLMEDPLSIDVSNLFDGCYEIMMRMLGGLFLQGGESRKELTKLADITVRLMTSGLGPLGEALTTLPARPSYPGLMAGLSFRFSRDVHTPTNQAAAWELSAYAGFIRSTEGVSEVLGRVSRALS